MKKTILFLEHCIDNTVGGSHYCLLEICRKINKENFHVIAAFYQKNDLLDAFREAGVDVKLLKPNRAFTLPSFIPGPLNKLIRLPVNLFKMFFNRTLYWRNIIRRFKVDIVHLNNTFTTDHDTILACIITGIPCIAHVRGIQPDIDGVSRILSKKLFAIISISEAVRRNLVLNRIPDDKIRLVFDGITPERINASTTDRNIRQEYGLSDDAKVIGIIGNIKKWKGQEIVVDAMLKLVPLHPSLHCFIVGSISDRDYHDKLVSNLVDHGIQDKVHFTGYQKNVADYLKSFDVFIHASIEPEPFGIVILEAMALRKPVIASNIGAPKEIIEENKSGLLFESGKSDDLARAVSVLLQDQELCIKMGNEGYERLYARFTSSINVKNLTKIYSEAIKHK